LAPAERRRAACHFLQETPVSALLESAIPGLPVRRGKVRDVYDLGQRLLIVASDRLSAFDVVLPTGIPDKGKVLTQISNFWFAFSGNQVKQHLIATDIAAYPTELRPYASQLAGRSVIVRKTKVIPIECIVRGYITGSGWKDYQKYGSVCGIRLPSGLQMSQQLPEPIFTPTTKADQGHDEAISFEGAAAQVGQHTMSFVRNASLRIYKLAAEYARTRGIIIADTKFEWGIPEGEKDPILIDEALTPDSSRFWPADQFAVGRDQASFDKQYVRNYLETLTWNKTYPGPSLPDEVVQNTRAKYIEAYERITGQKFVA
jgi:phosphoribosylaminoimidazole-succinocarboxamide synthase